MDKNKTTLYAVTWEDNVSDIYAYKLKNGKVDKRNKARMPENPIALMIQDPNSKNLFLITKKKIDASNKDYLGAIYEYNPGSKKVKLRHEARYDYKLPNKVGVVNKNLVFTIVGEPALIYNIKGNYLEKLNQNIHYKLFCIAPSKKGYLMMNVKDLNEGRFPLHFMDIDRNIDPNALGYFYQEQVIKAESRSFKLSTADFKTEETKWMIKEARYNSFPMVGTQASQSPYWLMQAYELEDAHLLRSILAANKKYLITQAGNKDIVVYRHKIAKKMSLAKLSAEEKATIIQYLDKRETEDREPVTYPIVEDMFKNQPYYVYLKNRLQRIEIKSGEEYVELKNYDQFLHEIKPDFRLTNEKDALELQELMGVFYPANDYDRKYIKVYNIESSWIFIRGKSFDGKFGYQIKVDSEGRPRGMTYITDL